MRCECCRYPMSECECDDLYPPPCARCYHCHKHCKCGSKYVSAMSIEPRTEKPAKEQA